MNSLFTEPKMPLSPSLTLPPPQSTYRWIVDDEDTMNSMQSAPNVHGFASPIFEMFGLRFYLVLYPNGSKITRKGTPNLFLNIASLQYGDMAVHVDQTVFIMNSYDRYIARHGMTSRGRGLLNSAGNFADWKGYDRYSFMVHIALIDVYRPADIDKSILAEYMDGIGDGDGVKVHEVPSREYVWECPLVFAINQPFGETEFSMFGLLWSATMSPLGQFGLRLMTKSAEGQYEVVSVRTFVEIEEFGIRFVMKGLYNDEQRMVDWGHHRLDLNQFLRLEMCTIKITMELIGVSFDGNNVTTKFNL